MLKTEQPDICPATYVGPILIASADFTDIEADNAASSTSGAAITDVAYATRFLHDKYVFPDSFFFRAETKSSVSGCTMRVGYVNDGQTFAAAIAANQFLTSTVDINTITNSTYFELTATDTAKIQPGGSIFLWASTQPTALANMRWGMRYTERQLAQ